MGYAKPKIGPHTCTKCKVNVFEGNHSWCKPCNAKDAAETRRVRRLLCLCIGCGTPKREKALCKKCLKKACEIQKSHRQTEKRKSYLHYYYNSDHGRMLNRERHYRRQNNIQYRLANTLRCRLRHALHGRVKSGSAVRDLGCSVDFLIKHFESQFLPGMNWSNYGIGIKCWTIDHIIPMYLVDLSLPENQLKVCHYTNLRPMWFLDNIKRYSERELVA